MTKGDGNAVIDPVHSLAFSVQANRGVYAVLIGSGVSRGAMIPTGWELTLDFIRKLAKLHEETSDPDPELWYREKFKQEANYSDLLDALAKTPAERQQLLRAYFEPNYQERKDGEKEPTAAHRSIATLAVQGFIKVILTTNFDRLMETALSEAGVVPTVLSTPDQVQGALPLIHTQCCVFKVHGDYLDTRIRNTPAELDRYPPEFDKLLDRIFDEFGLIVCGWSAEWDGALRRAIYRAQSRRFTTYWAVRGEPGDEVRRLIEHRNAQEIHIEDADGFFQTIQQSAESIEELSRPHPLSIQAAIASLKRYISDPRHRIQLSDFVGDTVEQVVEITTGEAFAVQGIRAPTTESATARARGYEAACSTLLAMASVGGFWVEEEHCEVWRRALLRLSPVGSNGDPYWLSFQCYPGTLLFYALGLGAVEAGRLEFLERMFATKIHREYLEPIPVVRLLPPFCLFSVHSMDWRAAQLLQGMERKRAPLNDWIHKALRQHAERIIPDDNRYTLVFDKFEILIALSYAYHEERSQLRNYWAPLGAFAYRSGYQSENRDRILQEIEESLSTEQDDSPFVTCGIFGETAESCKKGLENLKGFIAIWGS